MHRPSIETREVVGVETSCGAKRSAVAREAGRWVNRSGPSGRVNDAAVQDVIDSVVRARVEAWMADSDDGSYGIDRACSVALRFADGGNVRVLLGAEGNGGIYGRLDDKPEVFTVPARWWQLASSPLTGENADAH
jgi:hypothetical protein